MSKSASQTELAYFAGLFDGEGTIWMRERPCVTRSRYGSFNLVVSICNTHVPVIRWAQSLFGGTIYRKAAHKSTHTPALELSLFRKRDAAAFLSAVLPYLRIKRPQAEVALAFLALPHIRLHFRYAASGWPQRTSNEDDLKRRREMKQQLEALNRRGSDQYGEAR